jgi:MFS family permease
LLLPFISPRPPRETKRRAAPPRGDVDRLPLIVLAAGAMLGAAAANSIGVFLVASAVDAGLAASIAGYLLAVGSALGIITRLIVGALADRREGAHLVRVAIMLAGGCVGFALLAIAEPPVLFLIGTSIAFIAGWGWNGLFTFSVVRSYREAAAAATGLTQTGLWLGGMLGPLLFGLVAEARSFAAAWAGAGAVMLAAAVVIMVGSRLVMQAKEARAAGMRLV